MRRFHFGLEGLLRIRRYHEHERELELGRVTAQYERLLGQMNNIEEERRATANQMSGVDLSMRLSQGAYLELLQQTHVELEERRRTLEHSRREVLEAYTDALRNRKVIDNLKERRALEHYRGEAKKSDRELNEIGTLTAAMRRQEEEENG